MKNNTINFIRENNEKRTIELNECFKLTNKVLENTLKDLILNAQKLQKARDYGSVIESIKIQEDINDLIEFNTNIINELKFETQSEEQIENENSEYSEENNEVDSDNNDDISDYDEYSVDINEPHSLYEDFRHKRPYAFEMNGKMTKISTWREMLISTCNLLYKLNPKIFKSFVSDKSMSWGNTYNFAKDKSLLREATLVKGSRVYIETNKDSIAVRQLVIKMLKKYELDISEYKVYLRADYSSKHQEKEEQDNTEQIG